MPKKAKAKKSSKEAPEAAEPSDVKTEWDELSIEQLESAKLEMLEQLGECKAKRNYFLQERDTVQQFHEIVTQDIEEVTAKIRNTESEMERLQDAHHNDIRIYLQKVKHLEHDHRNSMVAIDEEGSKLRGNEAAAHENRKINLLERKNGLQRELARLEDANNEEILHIKELMGKEIVTLNSDFAASLAELKEKYEKKVEELRESLELRRRLEIHETEERKNLHISRLIGNHEKAFKEIKTYYFEITKDNLDLIKSVNEEYAALKTSEARASKRTADITAEHSNLTSQLAEVLPELKELRHKLGHYETDKISMKRIKARQLVLEQQLLSLTGEHEALAKKLAFVSSERDAIRSNFEMVISRLAEVKNSKQEQLGEQLNQALSKLSIQNSTLESVVASLNLDPSVVSTVQGKIDEVITSKKRQEKALREDISRVKAAHDDLIKVYESKLKNLGITDNE